MANNRNIKRMNAYKVNDTWYAIRIYDNGDFTMSPVSDNELMEMIEDLYSHYFSDNNVDMHTKFRELVAAGKINSESRKDFIFKITKEYELDKNDNKTEIEYTIERISGQKETTDERGFKKLSRGELKNTYGTSDVSKLQEAGIYQEKRKRLKFVKNLNLRNKKALWRVLSIGGILVIGGTCFSIGKNIERKVTQPKPSDGNNNNQIENQIDGDMNFYDYTPDNQTEINYDPSTPIPPLESTPAPYVDPQEVSSYCEISYIGENEQEVLPSERIEIDEYGNWLNQAYEKGNDAEFGGVDAIGNNLNNPEANPRPEYVNLINYVNVVDDPSDMAYITALANARNEISKTYITSSDHDDINNKIVDANKLLVYLIKNNGQEFNSGKTFDTLSPEAQNLVLQISQQIYRPLCSVNMTFADDMSGEIVDYNVMTNILVDAYDRINNGYSR